MKTRILSAVLLLCLGFPVLAQISASTPPADAGWYKIRVVQTGKYISVESGSEAVGARLLQWDYAGKLSQKFQVKKNADGTYSFFAANSSKAVCADKGNGSENDGIVQKLSANGSGNWFLYYSTQKSCAAGWIIRYRASDGLPIQVGSGGFLQLMPQIYQDADLDCAITYHFEAVEAPRTDYMKSPVIIKPGGIIRKKN